jgi:pimeloyl-ACP methyl ester carboxylesterase|tara:strand:- start:869 stop:1543 length:675 start_codon:yes stop_codon:yes gene_type:complete
MTSYLTFGKGPDLILGHGMAQNKNSWINSGWIEKLSKIRKIHIFDFQGHGANLSTKNDDLLSVQNMSNNIVKVSRSIKSKSFDYIGFSMGARAGFELAIKSKQLNKLISLGMHPGSPKLEEKRFKKRSIAMEKIGNKTGNKEYFIYSKIFSQALSWDGAFNKINWKKEKHLIVMGEKDDNFELTKNILGKKYLENLVILKGVNHKKTFDEPKHSLNTIIDFLKS